MVDAPSAAGAEFRGVRTRFLVLLGVLVALAGAQIVIAGRSRDARDSLADTVNRAGRQRMLAQRTAWAVHRLARGEGPREDVLREVARLESAHAGLAEEARAAEGEAAAVYDDLDRRMRAFAEAAKSVAFAPQPEAAPLAGVDTAGTAELVAELETAVAAHERDGRNRLQRIELDQMLLIVALVVVFLLVWRVAFRPLVARLRREVASVAALNERLRERVSEESAASLHRAAELAVTEGTLRDQTRLLEAVVENMGDALIVIDRSERVLVANPEAERLFGPRTGAALQDWVGDVHVLTPEGQEPVPYERRAIVRSLREGRGIVTTAFLPATEDRADVWISARARPLQDEAGRVMGALVVGRDVTASVQAEERLRQAQKMEAVGQLTGGMAHDFNNLLTVVLGNLEILEGDTPAERRDLVAAARDAAERGAELTRSLLAFSRRQMLRPRRVDVNRLVADMSQMLDRTLGESVALRTHTEPEVGPVLLDPHQLEAALLNLALNARDAMPEGGTLTVETRSLRLDEADAALPELAPGAYVVLSVSDTGQGMTAEVRARAFDPFFSTKPAGRGSGLGLSMVYGFVKQSGGHVRIYSEEGEGTTIRLYLPEARNEAEESEAATVPAERVRGGSETVLVVEDDPFVRDVAVRFLDGLGYAVREAGTPQEAFAVLEGEGVDVLFTDAVLPGESGGALARRALARWPHLKVLFASGYAANAVVHQGRVEPGVHLLSKPYTRAELAAVLRRVLEA